MSVIPTIMRKELIQTVRDPRMLVVILLAPVLQSVVFGFAVNLDVRAQALVVEDADHSAESRETARALINDDGFRLVGRAATATDAETAVYKGDAALALILPRGFGSDLSRGDAEVLLVMDGSDSNTALRAGQEATQLLATRAFEQQRRVLKVRMAASGHSLEGKFPEVSIASRAWFNPQMKTAIFLVPAVFALVLMIITTMLTSMGLTREKEIGTLEQIMVTPVRPLELMIGKTLPFALMGLLDVAVVVSVAALVFDLPVRGSLLSLFIASALFLMTTLGLGLFISTVSKTQQQAMLTTFFILLPALMLSGYVFPVDNMPEPVQWVTLLDPLRFYIELTRGIMVKGASLSELWRSVLSLTVLGVLALGAAALRFRKRIV